MKNPVGVLPDEIHLPTELYDSFRVAGVVPADERLPDIREEVSVAMRRRRWLRRAGGIDEVEATYIQLVRDGEVLHWELDGDYGAPRAGRRASRRGNFDVARTVIEQFKLVPAEGSAVSQMLSALDFRLNPSRGLRTVVNGTLGPPGVPVARGRILLLVHGTFATAESMVQAWNATPDGRNLLTWAQAHYDQVLAYDHATLSVSPILNGLELARAFAGSQAQIDVVCHSRGGLVVRWWLEVLDWSRRARTRVVFVGSPLYGSSLAAPNRLRGAMDMLTNAAFAIGDPGQIAAIALPWVGAIGGILRVLAAATGAVSKTPVLDAALAMIPGLAAQARTDNNFELQGLAGNITAVPPSYHFVLSNFQPVAADQRWKFWTYFTRIGAVAADIGADVVFTGNNDLAVDTASMTQLSNTLSADPGDRLLDFGTSTTVHHLNYFDQPDTFAFIARVLPVRATGAAMSVVRKRTRRARTTTPTVRAKPKGLASRRTKLTDRPAPRSRRSSS